jgi:hypothetical protein
MLAFGFDRHSPDRIAEVDSMIKAIILTPYAAGRYPAIRDDYPHPATQICNDITGRDQETIIPPVNLLLVEVFTNAQTFGAIAADGRYYVIQSETVEDE